MSIATTSPLARNDAVLLSVAASQHQGRLVLSKTLTPLSVKRLIGRLLKHGLIEARDASGETAHNLTPDGYAAVGMTPPPPPMSAGLYDAAVPKVMSKRELVLGLLSRLEGASLTELIAATSWLPHTTRAALSRLRSAGQVLTKSQRADGATANRIVPAEPSQRRSPAARPTRHKVDKSQSAAAV